MIDAKASVLELTVGTYDFAIKQSPGILQSTREGGTTGAAVWRLSPILASWISSPDNVLFKNGFLEQSSSVLELGSGIAGLVPIMLGPKVDRYVATDQQYALKLLQENIRDNLSIVSGSSHGKRKPRKDGHHINPPEVIALDWESDDIDSFLNVNGIKNGVDLVFASDCVYNYALIEPFVQTCVEVCRKKSSHDKPTICLVAQQLRQPDVMEDFLTAFLLRFDTFRLSDEEVGALLKPASGFAIHVGVLRQNLR